jgi:glycosyltransferase involved in cell wall biosynthesis
MDWIVFGDDWGSHPSTTQHLIRNLPDRDRIVWVNSIGGRAPRINRTDIGRMYRKLLSLTGNRKPRKRPMPMGAADQDAGWQPDLIVSPMVLPWHEVELVRRFNRRRLRKQVEAAMHQVGFDRPNVLMSFPVATWYLDFPHGKVSYLRLDDYEKLPGVDAHLIRECEDRVLQTCDFVFVTASSLVPDVPGVREKTHYIPQGVDARHFGTVPSQPPRSRVLGFFGLLAEWIDFRMIAEVARRLPQWTFEFVGPVRYAPSSLTDLPNVRLLPPEPYTTLPDRLHTWDAAWIPFNVDKLTESVNPLKLREYLAAGLPTLCTEMPEARRLGEHVHVVQSSDDVVAFLSNVVGDDTAALREARKGSVRDHTWTERARQLRDVFQNKPARREDPFPVPAKG